MAEGSGRFAPADWSTLSIRAARCLVGESHDCRSDRGPGSALRSSSLTTIDISTASPLTKGYALRGWPLERVADPDEARLAALHSYGILDTPPEAAFDDITRMAMMICGTPVAVISLIGADRQWFKSEAGIGLGELPFVSSIFAHSTHGADVFVVPDLHRDERFANHPLVTNSPGMRFYAGAPLQTAEGHTLGTVCVLDRVPRELDAEQTGALRSLARQVMVLFEFRRTARLTNVLLADADRLNAALGRADADKDEILSMIAHELNSPLAIIRGTADALTSGLIQQDQDRLEAYREISASSRRLRRVVENMLALTRGSATDQESEMEPQRLQHSFDAAIAEHTHLHPGSEVRLRLAPDLPVVYGEPTCLDQMVTNLLSNAAKYGAAREPITIAAEPWGSRVLVSVSNEGPLLNPENIERLFAPFYRESANRPAAPGVGLGLAVCRRLAEVQGGRIWAVARPGGGLDVNFTLPAVEPVADEG